MGKEFALPKVAVIGAGRVGSTTAFTLMVRGLAGEIVICNRNVDRAKGEALDIAHGVPLLNTTKISYGDYEACAGADVVVLTLGAAQKPGETRLELVKRNADIFREVVPQIVKAAPDAVLLIVSNPVDVLTYLTTKVAGLPAGRVFGSGTVLDTARARFEIARFEPCDMRDLQVFVLGEHGDSEVIPWSIYQVGGMTMAKELAYYEVSPEDARTVTEEVESNVRNAAYEIIRCKGSTHYAVSVCVARIVEAVLLNQQSILTVSTMLEGEYGIHDVCLSTPCVVGREGVLYRAEAALNEEETAGLRRSAERLRETIAQIM